MGTFDFLTPQHGPKEQMVITWGSGGNSRSHYQLSWDLQRLYEAQAATEALTSNLSQVFCVLFAFAEEKLQ